MSNKMTTNNKQIKSLKQRLTAIAMEWAETCWDFENGDECPRRKCDLFESLDAYIGATCSDCDDEFEEKRLLLMGAMTFGCEENTMVDWDEVLEFVEGLYDAYEAENKEDEEDEEDEEIESYICHGCCRSENQTKEERETYDPLCKACYDKEEQPQTEGEKAHARVWNAQIESYTKQFLVA